MEADRVTVMEHICATDPIIAGLIADQASEVYRSSERMLRRHYKWERDVAEAWIDIGGEG